MLYLKAFLILFYFLQNTLKSSKSCIFNLVEKSSQTENKNLSLML